MANNVRRKCLIKNPPTFPISTRMLFKEVNLNEIVQAVAGLFAQHLNENIRVKMELAPERLSIMADKTRMGAAVMNLVKNAAEAMPDGGTLTISTKLVSSQTDRRSSAVGSCALVSVTNTGVGMDRVTAERVFEPDSARKPGIERRLGPSIAQSIIMKHNGCLRVESARGKGTTVKIYLPTMRAATQEEDVALAARSSFG